VVKSLKDIEEGERSVPPPASTGPRPAATGPRPIASAEPPPPRNTGARPIAAPAPAPAPSAGSAVDMLRAVEEVQRKEVAAIKAMVELLIEKGVFTRDEYLAKVKR
jgi:hypothetical protein